MLPKYVAIFWGATILAAFGVAPASAQVRPEAYVIGGAGKWSNNFTSGTLVGGAGGLEVLLTPHVGAGAEVGALASGSGGLMLAVSVDGRLHFRDGRAMRTWAPYAVGGYSRLWFFERTDNALHFGAGIDYRVSAGRAVRLELRDIRRGSGVTSHYWTARVGVTFR